MCHAGFLENNCKPQHVIYRPEGRNPNDTTAAPSVRGSSAGRVKGRIGLKFGLRGSVGPGGSGQRTVRMPDSVMRAVPSGAPFRRAVKSRMPDAPRAVARPMFKTTSNCVARGARYRRAVALRRGPAEALFKSEPAIRQLPDRRHLVHRDDRSYPAFPVCAPQSKACRSSPPIPASRPPGLRSSTFAAGSPIG